MPAHAYATWLRLLLALFVVRVVAQPLALLPVASFLPAFESWHSGALPYPFLVLSQLALIAWLWREARRFSVGSVVPSRRLGVIALVVGAVYMAVMLLRLVLGATLLSSQRWFASPLPTMFHLVLASAVLVYGHFHFRYGPQVSALSGARHDQT